jgi:polyisoprenoid-binding protein YceI
VAVGLHVAGAFKHHFIDKDSTLMRMSFLKGPVGAGLLLLVAIAFFGGVGYLVFKPEAPSDEQAQTAAPVHQFVAGEPNLTGLAENGWAIVPGISRVEFKVGMGGTPFTGHFGELTGTVIFDPNNLEASKADIIIDVAAATTNNPERDAQIGGADWFNVAMWPTAHFQTITFEKGADNNYVAVGNLTIRDTTLPVTVPFTLELGQNDKGQKTATMKGTAEINRLDFGVGQGQWAAEDTIAGPVAVAISVTAVQP